jgi:hypothetical protein
MPGALVNGTVVDVWSARPLSFDKPAIVSHQFPNQRWRKYLMTLWEVEHLDKRVYFGRYMCQRWNGPYAKRDTPWALSTFSLLVMEQPTGKPGSTEQPKVNGVILWRHKCFPEEGEPEGQAM